MFLLLQAPAFILIPVLSRLQARISSRSLMTFGFLAMMFAPSDSNADVTNRDVTSFVLPSLWSAGLAFTLSPITALP